MEDFKRLLDNINKLDINDIFNQLWSDNKTQNFIIELNTEGQPTSQLFKFGIDSKGVSLGDYSDFTIQLKIEDGQPFDRITLKDTGDFYETFVVRPLKKGFSLNANPNKDGDNLFKNFGEDIVGLTKDNEIVLAAFIEKDFNDELEKRLFR